MSYTEHINGDDHPIYTRLEVRVLNLQKATEYGTDAHRKLVLMLVELADMVLPAWKGEEPTPATCIRVAKTFGEDGKANGGTVKQLRQRIFWMNRKYTYPTDPLGSLLVKVTGDVLDCVFNPLNAKGAVDSIKLAYIEVAFGRENVNKQLRIRSPKRLPTVLGLANPQAAPA